MTTIIEPISVMKKGAKIKKKVSFIEGINIKEFHSPQKRSHIKENSFPRSKSSIFSTYPEENKSSELIKSDETPIFTIVNNTILYKKNIPLKESKCSFKRVKYMIEQSPENLNISFSKPHNNISQFTLTPYKENQMKEKHSMRYANINTQQEEVVESQRKEERQDMRYSVRGRELNSNQHKLKENIVHIRSSVPLTDKRLHIPNEFEDEKEESKFLKQEIENVIAEIKKLDRNSYKIDQESSALKADMYINKLKMDKITLEYVNVKESIKKQKNELKVIQRQHEAIKSSIIVLIKKRLKSKSQNQAMNNYEIYENDKDYYEDQKIQ